LQTRAKSAASNTDMSFKHRSLFNESRSRSGVPKPYKHTGTRMGTLITILRLTHIITENLKEQFTADNQARLRHGAKAIRIELEPGIYAGHFIGNSPARLAWLQHAAIQCIQYNSANAFHQKVYDRHHIEKGVTNSTTGPTRSLY
jgi:hypothetical protein